jgi:hypothetical protein
MSWRQTAIGFLGDAMRFLSRMFILSDLILISGFSVWFVWRFLAHLCRWLDKTIFNSPW